MVPKYYSASEEGGFKPWPYGFVDSGTLSRYRPDQEYIYVNGVQVFSFSFPDGIGELGEQRFKVWNCKTGWQMKGML